MSHLYVFFQGVAGALLARTLLLILRVVLDEDNTPSNTRPVLDYQIV